MTQILHYSCVFCWPCGKINTSNAIYELAHVVLLVLTPTYQIACTSVYFSTH